MTALILNTGSAWEPAAEQVAKWKLLYRAIDVDQELNAMAGWLDANPTKRKTERGIARFCNSWLSRAQDKGGSGMTRKRADGIPTRDMTTLDDLTHDFMDCPNWRAFALRKYGQYYSHDGVMVKS
jgi:hypothetical protein